MRHGTHIPPSRTALRRVVPRTGDVYRIDGSVAQPAPGNWHTAAHSRAPIWTDSRQRAGAAHDVRDPRRGAHGVHRPAGAVILGKVTTHEFAFGFDAPPTANPWNTGHAPSGSSGGTGAALAAGFCLGGMGSDTGGSIRAPAAACGVSGIKPTYGRVSKHGVAVLSWSLDHTGPMARSARDLAVMLNVIAGPDPLDPTTIDVPVEDHAASLTGDISGVRIGVPRNFFFDQGEPAVEAAVRDAIAELESLNAEDAFPPTGGPVRRRRTPPSRQNVTRCLRRHRAPRCAQTSTFQPDFGLAKCRGEARTERAAGSSSTPCGSHRLR